MSTTSRRPALLIRLVAATILLCTGTMARGPVQAAGITPEAALVRVLTVQSIQPSWFAPPFLAQISVAQVRQVITGITGQLGPYKSVAAVPDGSFLVRFQDGTAKARIDLDNEGRIDGLGFTDLKLTSTPPAAHGNSLVSPAAQAAAIDALLSRRTHDHAFSGSVLVALQGRVILSKAYGYADVARRTPNTITTEFRIGSISKQFTAVAILRLQEAGKLSIHDRLCHYIRSCPKAWKPITLRMLLTHTSGLPTALSVPGYTADVTKPISVEQEINLIKRVPLDRMPGASYEYSNANFDLLGAIVEQVARMPYATYLQRHIFDPLSMRHTGYDTDHPKLPLHAIGYGTWAAPAPYIDMSWLYAAGAMYSTVGDLRLWDQALANDVVLSKASTADMFAAHAAICGGAVPCGSYGKLAYGYGWVRGELGGHLIIWHNGEINGFVAMNEFLPKQGITIIVLSNLQTSGAGNVLGVQLANLMLGPT